MDNASFHRGPLIQQMFEDAGVKLLYLPPYSPDLNPIEQWFAQLKALIKTDFPKFTGSRDQNFGQFLQRCVDIAGSDQKRAPF